MANIIKVETLKSYRLFTQVYPTGACNMLDVCACDMNKHRLRGWETAASEGPEQTGTFARRGESFKTGGSIGWYGWNKYAA